MIRFKRYAIYFIVLFSLLASSVLAYSQWRVQSTFDNIPRFDALNLPAPSPPTTAPSAAGVTTPPTTPAPHQDPVTYLVFSTGSSHMTKEEADHLGITWDRAQQADGLTDSIMLIVTNPNSKQVGILSIPRDLWIPSIHNRINAIYNLQGPQALADAVSNLTGLPVNHMIAVSFTAFADLTDAVGGVDLFVPGPSRDLNTGFVQDAPACRHMDGPTALAFARSRHWEVKDSKGWHSDITSSDFGRMDRQQALLQAVYKKFLDSPSLLLNLPAFLDLAQKDLTIDNGLDLQAVQSMVKQMMGANITFAHVPGVSAWEGQANVLHLDKPAADPIFASMQQIYSSDAPPPAPTPAPPVASGSTTPAEPAQAPLPSC